ncbi:MULTISPECIES: hypothetical protein [unclassified Jeotgalibaca]|uniref:hypothetical protein n=1 Tax=unclassified Jeotgalibaca TaxID=2621505 RepID=UPI003FCFD1D5
MILRNRYIVGCYDSVEKVVAIIRQLKEKGCTNEDITLITHENFQPTYAKSTEAEVTTEEKLWQEVKDSIAIENRPMPDYRTDDDPLYGYQEDLEEGCVLVLVKGTKQGLLNEKYEEESQYMDKPVDNQAMLDATDAMRSNVITSTGEGVVDSGLANEDVDESLLHDNDPHTGRH